MIKSSIIFLAAFSLNVLANDGAFLDPKYPNLVHPKKSTMRLKGFVKSNTVALIETQSAVKSQGGRGTCSIFSAAAYLENLLIQKGYFDNDLNLSEEWLQYAAVRGSLSDGSYATKNFNAIRNFGVPSEITLPYDSTDWVEGFGLNAEGRCGHLKSALKTACLVVHFDPALMNKTDVELMNKSSVLFNPEFVTARSEALEYKTQYIKFANTNHTLYQTNEIKERLLKGQAVIFEADFYYGAWNHRVSESLGIKRDMNLWNKGIVTAPVAGSLDLDKSPSKPAGHSVVLVGFDDEKIVKANIQMTDGTIKEVTFKGVYYFKNSWGQDSFGRDFEVDGKKFPGYGMIVQDYADNYGSFYVIELK